MPRGGANRGQGRKKSGRTQKCIGINDEFIPLIDQEATETARSQADIVNKALAYYFASVAPNNI